MVSMTAALTMLGAMPVSMAKAQMATMVTICVAIRQRWFGTTMVSSRYMIILTN